MAIVFLTRRSPQKTIPTANFHFKATLKILPIFYLGFLKKISDKSFSQKLYSKLSPPPKEVPFFFSKTAEEFYFRRSFRRYPQKCFQQFLVYR